MANMSSSRFYNTLIALRDCENNMDEVLESEDEQRARKQLIDVCWRIAQEYGDEVARPNPNRAWRIAQEYGDSEPDYVSDPSENDE